MKALRYRAATVIRRELQNIMQFYLSIIYSPPEMTVIYITQHIAHTRHTHIHDITIRSVEIG